MERRFILHRMSRVIEANPDGDLEETLKDLYNIYDQLRSKQKEPKVRKQQRPLETDIPKPPPRPEPSRATAIYTSVLPSLTDIRGSYSSRAHLSHMSICFSYPCQASFSLSTT